MPIHSCDRRREDKRAGGDSKPKPLRASADRSSGTLTSRIPSYRAGLDGAGDIPRRLIHSPREAEILLGISHAQVYRLIARNRLRAVKVGARTGITRESIEAVAAGEV
jgi:excisionase family DNA binding protein